MASVAILGGGITGLSCAYYLKTLGKSKIKYLFLLERSPKFGGWIQTTRFPDGALFEHGPRTLRSNSIPGRNALFLADELGLSSRILSINKSHPTAKTNFILANNELCPVPRNISSMIRTFPPFSKPFALYALKEFRTKKKEICDESVYSFAERRVGKEVADYILDPGCRGIAAGDARELSIRSMFPTMYEAEQQYGSVIKGAFKSKDFAKERSYKDSELVTRSYSEFWRMWTLKDGLTELIDTLACAVEEKGYADLHFSAECTGLNFKNNKAVVSVDGENIEVDHVFSCIPSNDLTKLVSYNSTLRDALLSIPYVNVAVVYLEYNEQVLTKQGFGMLVPSFEDSRVLGIVFDSCCFPELNGTSKTRLTCMIGGKWFEQILGSVDSASEDAILLLAIEEVQKHLKINDIPIRHKVVVHKQCIAQYVVGHYKKIESLDKEIASKNMCLTLLGASYNGVGVPDCIYNSKLSVTSYLNSLLLKY